MSKPYSAICILHGKYTFKFNNDVFSKTDELGRLWMNPEHVKGESNKILSKIKKEIKEKYEKFLSKIPYKSQSLIYFFDDLDLNYSSKIPQKEKRRLLNKVINEYLKISDDVYKKYKKELTEVVVAEMLKLDNLYNELFAYDYKVKGIVIYDNPDNKISIEETYKQYKELITKNKNVEYVELSLNYFTDEMQLLNDHLKAIYEIDKKGIPFVFEYDNATITKLLKSYLN
jgi:hypothetical protein